MAKAKIIISAKKPDTNHDYIEILKTVSIEEARTLSKIFENNSSPTQIARQFKIDESEIPTVKAFLHSKIEHATISYAASK